MNNKTEDIKAILQKRSKKKKRAVIITLVIALLLVCFIYVLTVLAGNVVGTRKSWKVSEKFQFSEFWQRVIPAEKPDKRGVFKYIHTVRTKGTCEILKVNKNGFPTELKIFLENLSYPSPGASTSKKLHLIT